MLALIFIYFVGKAFYDLAGKHGKNQWGFAILGVASYYGAIFAAGFIIAIIAEIGFTEHLDWIVPVMTIPIGLLSCWGTYQFLKRSWSKPADRSEAGRALDSDLMRYDKNER